MRFSHLRRRAFINLLGGAAVAWPFPAHAQQSDRLRRIGALMPTTADDPVGREWLAALLQGLLELGWSDGRNLRIETRWTGGSPDVIRRQAAELVALAPNVILA